MDPIVMGDHEDQLGDREVDTGGGSGGPNTTTEVVVQTQPQSSQFRVWRDPGASLWQLQGLLDEEARSLEIIKQGVINNKRAIARSNQQWQKRFKVADKALLLTMGSLEDLIKDEATAAREPREAKQKIIAHLDHYRGLLDEWLSQPVVLGQPKPDPIISMALYSELNHEIESQIDKISDEQEVVQAKISAQHRHRDSQHTKVVRCIR